jgi:dihydrodipicolinate synthase/N-acetylneuraminate lyase
MLPERWSGLQGQLLLAAGLLVLAAASAVAVTGNLDPPSAVALGQAIKERLSR